MNPTSIVLYAGVIVFFIYRQFTAQKSTLGGLFLVPAIIAFGALQTIGQSGSHLSMLDAAFLAANGVLGIAMGLWRGLTFKVWAAADGSPWRQGTWMTLVNWLALVAMRVVAAIAATFAGLAPGQMTGDLLVALFLTFTAQNLVIWLRSEALSSRRPATEVAVR